MAVDPEVEGYAGEGGTDDRAVENRGFRIVEDQVEVLWADDRVNDFAWDEGGEIGSKSIAEEGDVLVTKVGAFDDVRAFVVSQKLGFALASGFAIDVAWGDG